MRYQAIGNEEIKKGDIMNTVTYDEEKVNQVLALLSRIPTQGPAQVGAMGAVYDILSHPVSEKRTRETTKES